MRMILTQQHRSRAKGQRTPFFHNQLRSEEQCSCYCPKHQPLLQPPEVPVRISPENGITYNCLLNTSSERILQKTPKRKHYCYNQ